MRKQHLYQHPSNCLVLTETKAPFSDISHPRTNYLNSLGDHDALEKEEENCIPSSFSFYIYILYMYYWSHKGFSFTF